MMLDFKIAIICILLIFKSRCIICVIYIYIVITPLATHLVSTICRKCFTSWRVIVKEELEEKRALASGLRRRHLMLMCFSSWKKVQFFVYTNLLQIYIITN